jgi:hypothetical protein
LNTNPSKKQCSFYAKFPQFRGISDSSLDPEIIEAVLIAALTFGMIKDRVFFFSPVAHETWILDQFRQVIETMFAESKRWPNREAIVKGYGLMFKRIIVTGRLLQILKEPEYWVSFGFTLEDIIPEWMEPRLSKIII